MGGERFAKAPNGARFRTVRRRNYSERRRGRSNVWAGVAPAALRNFVSRGPHRWRTGL